MNGPKRDLSLFKELTDSKASWGDRVVEIHRQFPSTRDFDWRKAFNNNLDLFGRMLNDILKLDQAPPGRPGPRPALDQDEARRKMRQYLGQDYSELPFREALEVLRGERSIRHLAAKVDLDKNMVFRLLKGEIEPDSYILRKVAAGFGKAPSYFTEWRTAFIIQALMHRLDGAPEANIGLYRRLVKQADIEAS